MKIVVLGASGCTGRQIVSQGIAAGLAVTAVVRCASVTFPDPQPRIVCGDIFDSAFLRGALRATDAVLFALGNRRINRATTALATAISSPRNGTCAMVGVAS